MFRIFLMGMCLTSVAFGQSKDSSFSRTDTPPQVLSKEELRNQLEVTGEIFVTDQSGKKLLYQMPQTRIWEFGSKGNLLSDWSLEAPGIKTIAIRHEWEVSKDGELVVDIKQYDSMKREEGGSREVVYGKLIRGEKITMNLFSPIVWTAFSDPTQKVVVRLTPRIEEKNQYLDIAKLPISLSNPVILDSNGKLWGRSRDIDGAFIGLTTVEGTVAFSYYPFNKAKEIGYADGSEIVINDGENKIYIKCDHPVLSSNRRAKIYGFIDKKHRSDRVDSISAFSGNEAEKTFNSFY